MTPEQAKLLMSMGAGMGSANAPSMNPRSGSMGYGMSQGMAGMLQQMQQNQQNKRADEQMAMMKARQEQQAAREKEKMEMLRRKAMMEQQQQGAMNRLISGTPDQLNMTGQNVSQPLGGNFGQGLSLNAPQIGMTPGQPGLSSIIDAQGATDYDKLRASLSAMSGKGLPEMKKGKPGTFQKFPQQIGGGMMQDFMKQPGGDFVKFGKKYSRTAPSKTGTKKPTPGKAMLEIRNIKKLKTTIGKTNKVDQMMAIMLKKMSPELDLPVGAQLDEGRKKELFDFLDNEENFWNQYLPEKYRSSSNNPLGLQF